MEGGKQFIFIVGSGRSGTTLLRNILAEHMDIGVCPELKFFDVILASRVKMFFLSWEKRTRMIARRIVGKYKKSEDPLWSRFTFTEEEIHAEIQGARSYREIFVILLRKFSTKPTARIQVEKTPTNVFFIKEIRRYFPDAKIINMVRDGREVAASAKKRNWSENSDELAIWWKEAVNAFKKWSKGKDNFIEIKYEDLVQSPESVASSIFRFIGVNTPENLKDVISRVESFSSFYGQSKKGIYESRHFEEVFEQPIATRLEMIMSTELDLLGYNRYYKNSTISRGLFQKLLKVAKIRLNLFSRKAGIFWILASLSRFAKKHK